MHLVKLQNTKDGVTPAAEGSLKADTSVTDTEKTSSTSSTLSDSATVTKQQDEGNNNSLLYTVLAAIGAIGAGAFGVLKKKNVYDIQERVSSTLIAYFFL